MAVRVLASPYDSAKIIDYPDGSYSVEPTGLDGAIITTSVYTVKEGDTLQGIAHALYGDSGLWYVLAEANNIQNPFDIEEFYAGQILNVP